MKKKAIIVVLFITLAILLGNQYTASLETSDEWFNSTWHYRIKIDVNTSEYDRTSWPVEYEMNFTQMFEQMNITGTFDNESVRVFEYNDTGDIIAEIPSQFDEALDYDESNNAVGTLVFMLNGTTSANTLRQFYVYFDRTDTGAKSPKTYNTGMEISGINGEYVINNTKFAFKFDTERGENTSGLWQVQYRDQDETNLFNPSGSSDKTREFTIISDGNYNYTFDLRGNATIIEGPVRITVRQEGYEAYWNDPDNKTNLTKIVKEYYFYFNNTDSDSDNTTFVIVRQNITNVNDSNVFREAVSGFPGMDVTGAYGATYKVASNLSVDPGSWVRGTYSLGGQMTGIINVNETGTSNFIAGNDSGADRIGIDLTNTTIQPGESLIDVAAIVFGDTISTPDIITDVRDRLVNPLNITLYAPEGWWIEIEPKMYASNDLNVTIFNRNESSLVVVNITYDPFNFTAYANATFNNGTVDTSDDITVILYDDGTHGDNQSGDAIFSNYFNFTNVSTLGEWNYTVRIYDSEGYYLNETVFIFNITNLYNLTMYIWNDTGLPRTTNATLNLTTYRKDIMIPGANITCSYDTTTLPDQNITDLGDGTYNITFYTTDKYGLYYLNCTATKDGNSDNASRPFTVESPQTNVAVTTQPVVYELYNITYFNNESFNLLIILNNTGNSSAYDTNITITLPPELTANTTFYDDVDTILVESEKSRLFNITVLNYTTSGEYLINVTINWTNLNGSLGYNQTFVNVTIYDNPEISVPDESRLGIIAPGNFSIIDNFTVISYGNDILNNITFNVTNPDNFTVIFTPPNISSMNPGEIQEIEMNVSVPSYQKTGIYNLTINISTNDGGYDNLTLQIIVSGTNMSLVVNPEYHIAYNITAFENENFTFTVNTTNTGNTTAFYVSMNFSLPQNWTIINQSIWCGNVTRGSFCYDQFNVTVSNLTPPGNYTVNVTINWEDIDIGLKSNMTNIEVEVVSNVTFEVPEELIEYTIWHGTEELIGTFNLNPTGNDMVQEIDFNLTGLENFTVVYNQSYPLNLSAGNFTTVSINVSVPSGYSNGTYNATLNLTTNNSGFQVVNLSVTVPIDGNWTTNTTSCDHLQTPAEGVLCYVLINNSGNMLLNFSVTPASVNYTNVSKTSFSIDSYNNTVLTFYYNVTGIQGQQDWVANYTIDALQTYANLSELYLIVSLSRFIKAEIDVEVYPNMTQQLGAVNVWVNVTSVSGATIPWVELNVTSPNGTNYIVSMQQLYWFGCTGSGSNSVSCWYSSFPSTWGDSSLRGNYTVIAFVNDSIGVNSSNSSILSIYARYMVNISMDQNYVQGDWARVRYRAHDAIDSALPGCPVNISVLDPNGDSLYMMTGEEYTTDGNGKITQTSFVIPSDAPTGSYTVLTNGTYLDTDVNIWLNNQTNYTFSVGEEASLSAKVTVPTSVYVNYMMPVSIIVLEHYNEPVDPDAINLTIYRTEGYSLDLWRQLNMSHLNHTSTGFYSYQEVIGDTVLTGTYLAVLHVTKGDKETYDIWPFRISRGGPYDAIITRIDGEAPQGGAVTFDLYVENKGEVSHQDVNITYWVSDGQTWYMNMFAANLAAGENKTFTDISANIFTNQPPGDYFMNVRVRFDPFLESAPANASFRVTSAGPPPPPGGGEAAPSAPSGPAGPAVPAALNITKYEKEVGVEIGVQRLVNVVVRNTGGSTVNDLKLEISGPAKDWIEVEPTNLNILRTGSESVFTLKIMVPRGEPSGQFNVRMKAVSNEVSSSEETFSLFVFTSRKDLIEFELVRLKAKLDELENEADNLEEQGIDVSDVKDKLSEAKKKIEIAEEYLNRKLYDASLDAVYTAWKLLREAEEMLEELKGVFQLPWWLIVIIVFIAAILILTIVIRRVTKNLRMILRGRMSEARMVAESVKGSGIEIDRMKDERIKAERTLNLLESQYKQDIISKPAYESMKKRSESKIKELDRKIKERLMK